MKTLAQMVLALTMVGCTTVNQEPLAVRQMSIEEVMEDKRKIKVTVKIFGRKTPVELNFGEVELE